MSGDMANKADHQRLVVLVQERVIDALQGGQPNVDRALLIAEVRRAFALHDEFSNIRNLIANNNDNVHDRLAAVSQINQRNSDDVERNTATLQASLELIKTIQSQLNDANNAILLLKNESSYKGTRLDLMSKIVAALSVILILTIGWPIICE